MQKILLLMIFSCFGFLLSAQIQPKVTLKTRQNEPTLRPGVIDRSSVRRLNGDNYIANLAQDNMPCIIPARALPQIPNTFGGGAYGNIPNAWQPKKDTSNQKHK